MVLSGQKQPTYVGSPEIKSGRLQLIVCGGSGRNGLLGFDNVYVNPAVEEIVRPEN